MKVLFVCSGNICRSPLAEALLRARAAGNAIPGIDVSSAGTLRIEGLGADPLAVAVAAEAGLDLSSHRSRGVSRDLLAAADLVAVMEREHLRESLALAPRHRGLRILTEFLPESDAARVRGEVPDPVGGTLEEFRACLALMTRCVDALLPTLVPTVDEEEYFRRIAGLVARARGGAPTLSSMEFHIADRWWQQRVPLWLTVEALEAAASLWPEGEAPRSFMKHVESEMTRRRDEPVAEPPRQAVTLGVDEATDPEGVDAMEGACRRLREGLESALPALGAGTDPLKEAIRAAILRFAAGPSTRTLFESELAAAASEITRAAERCLPRREVEELREEATRRLRAQASNLPPEARQGTFDRLLREKILRRFALPSFSILELLPPVD